MSTDEGEWVLVKSEDELHEGMLVEVRNCVFCGAPRERLFLLKSRLPHGKTMNFEGVSVQTGSRRGFECSGVCRPAIALAGTSQGEIRIVHFFFEVIAEGRLFRQVVTDPYEDDVAESALTGSMA